MKSSNPTAHFPRILSLMLVVLLVAPGLGGAQENKTNILVAPPRQVPLKPVPAAPVRPVPRPVPARVQPQVQRPVAQQPRRVQPVVNAAGARPAAGQAAQNRAQINRGQGGNNLVQRQAGGVHPQGATGNRGMSASGLRLPPNARSMAMPGGGTGIIHPDGRRWLVDKNNRVTAFSRPGLEAKFNENGRLSTVHVVRPNNNMLVARSVRGERETFAVRPGGVIVVTYGKGRGFVQRPIPGRPGYFERTTLVDGRPSAHVYRLNRYRGVMYLRPVPAYTYQPQFYQWVRNSLPAPIAYNWGAQPAPWLSSFGSYFTPASSYSTPASWLTDFALSQNLKLAYQDRQEYEQTPAGAPQTPEAGSETTPLSPEVKGAIAQQVQQQVSDEQAASGQPAGPPAAGNNQAVPPVLDPDRHTFVMTQALDVPQGGQSCTLTPGDVINRTGDNMMAGNKVAASVVASKAGDCPANSSTQVDVAILQDMDNQFHDQVDAGIDTLAASQAHGGLPSEPPPGTRPNQEGTAQPDSDAAMILAQQQTDADAAEGAAKEGADAVGAS